MTTPQDDAAALELVASNIDRLKLSAHTLTATAYDFIDYTSSFAARTRGRGWDDGEIVALMAGNEGLAEFSELIDLRGAIPGAVNVTRNVDLFSLRLQMVDFRLAEFDAVFAPLESGLQTPGVETINGCKGASVLHALQSWCRYLVAFTRTAIGNETGQCFDDDAPALYTPESVLPVCEAIIGQFLVGDVTEIADNVIAYIDADLADYLDAVSADDADDENDSAEEESLDSNVGNAPNSTTPKQKTPTGATNDRRATLLAAILRDHHFTAEGMKRDVEAVSSEQAAATLRGITKRKQGTSAPNMSRAWTALFQNGYRGYCEHVRNPALERKLRQILMHHLPPDRGASLDPEFHSERVKTKF